MSSGGGSATVTLPTDEQILIVREFDAPRELVYEAWTTPAHVRRWWSGRRGAMTACEIDLRVGGRWRYAMTTSAGGEVAFHGEYREIVPGERIVNTEVLELPGVPEPAPDEAALNIVTFAERAGGTTLSLLVQTNSRELRDMIVASGMEEGMQEQMDLLEELAAELG